MSTNYNFDKDQARATLKKAGYLVDVLWHKDDIRQQANNLELPVELTDDQVDDVADHLMENFDANYGIDWTAIELAIQHILDDN